MSKPLLLQLPCPTVHTRNIVNVKRVGFCRIVCKLPSPNHAQLSQGLHCIELASWKSSMSSPHDPGWHHRAVMVLCQKRGCAPAWTLRVLVANLWSMDHWWYLRSGSRGLGGKKSPLIMSSLTAQLISHIPTIPSERQNRMLVAITTFIVQWSALDCP